MVLPPFPLMFSKWIYWPLGEDFASSPLLAGEGIFPHLLFVYLWMKTGTEEEEDKRERGRRGRGVSQKKKKSEPCSDVFQSQLQKGWALLVSLEGRRLS